jgi:hypothetical protein
MSTEEIYEALQEATIVNQKIKDIIFKLKDSNENLEKQLLNHIITDEGASEIYYRGYKLSDLFSLAVICGECKISPADLTDNIENIKKIYQRIQDQAWENFKRQLSSCFELFK